MFYVSVILRGAFLLFIVLKWAHVSYVTSCTYLLNNVGKFINNCTIFDLM